MIAEIVIIVTVMVIIVGLSGFLIMVCTIPPTSDKKTYPFLSVLHTLHVSCDDCEKHELLCHARRSNIRLSHVRIKEVFIQRIHTVSRSHGCCLFDALENIFYCEETCPTETRVTL